MSELQRLSMRSAWEEEPGRIERDLAAILGVDADLLAAPSRRRFSRHGLLLAALVIPVTAGVLVAATYRDLPDPPRWLGVVPKMRAPHPVVPIAAAPSPALQVDLVRSAKQLPPA